MTAEVGNELKKLSINDEQKSNKNDMCIELDHIIGFNVYSHDCFHSLSTKNVTNKENNNNDSNNDSNYDYLVNIGSSLVLNKWNDVHNQIFLQKHNDNIICSILSPNKEYIASSETGKTPDILIWDVNNKKCIYKFEEHIDDVKCMAFSDDSRFLATVGGFKDRKLIIWDINSCVQYIFIYIFFLFYL